MNLPDVNDYNPGSTMPHALRDNRAVAAVGSRAWLGNPPVKLYRFFILAGATAHRTRFPTGKVPQHSRQGFDCRRHGRLSAARSQR